MTLLPIIPNFDTELQNLFHQDMVGVVQQVPFYLLQEKRSDVVLVLSNHERDRLVVGGHRSLERACEDSELLVVGVRI